MRLDGQALTARGIHCPHYHPWPSLPSPPQLPPPDFVLCSFHLLNTSWEAGFWCLISSLIANGLVVFIKQVFLTDCDSVFLSARWKTVARVPQRQAPEHLFALTSLSSCHLSSKVPSIPLLISSSSARGVTSPTPCPIILSLGLGHASQNPPVKALLFLGQFMQKLGIEKLENEYNIPSLGFLSPSVSCDKKPKQAN